MINNIYIFVNNLNNCKIYNKYIIIYILFFLFFSNIYNYKIIKISKKI